MKYIMLLWPHANARYQAETVKLASAELRLMLDRLAPAAEVSPWEALPMPALAIETGEPLASPVVEALRSHSLLYGLFALDGDGALLPVAGRAEAYLGADLPAILKYKGKTNEMFLQLLVNAALYAGDFWDREGEALSLLDPMCGRATGLFVAANRGWNAVGADVDRTDLKEAEKFLKRYLEYHRLKHDVRRESRTLVKGKAAEVCRFEFAPTPEAYRAGDTRSLSLACLDASRSAEAFGRKAFHIVACDLPYGVRHDAQLPQGAKGKNWLEALLRQALPAWRESLKPGGAVAVSFNAQTLKPDALRAMMAEAGLEVRFGGPWDGFSHWVEQAITRDIAVAVRTR